MSFNYANTRVRKRSKTFYIEKGEEWCTANAEEIDWDVFVCDMNVFSKEFQEAFRNEIKTYVSLGHLGKPHRCNGPAVIKQDGTMQWWLNGRHYASSDKGIFGHIKHPYTYIELGEDLCTDFADHINWNIFEFHADIFSKEFGETFRNEIKFWRYKGKFHREDGPAFVNSGTESWFRHGKLHREDGPAVKTLSGPFAGTLEWHLDGHQSRLDGPSQILHTPEGIYRQWKVRGSLHREDGPAKIRQDGSMEWWSRGKKHRVDGPAYIGADGERKWFIHNQQITEEEFLKRFA